MNTIGKLSETLISEKGVNALAVRPNVSAAYGESGLTANQLKEWFDQVPFALKEKINEIIGIVNDGNLSKYIPTGYEGTSIETLADVFGAIESGKFSEILQAHKGDAASLASLQEILIDIYKELSKIGDIPLGPDETPAFDSVMEYILAVEERIEREVRNPEGNVAKGESRPVSGDKIYEAIAEASPDISDVREDIAIIREAIDHNTNVSERNEKRISILEMANEGNTYSFEPYNEIKYKHPVPATALPYARLDSIGGYTRKSKNLLKLLPNMEIPLTGDQLPIAYSTDSNGYFCIDGDGGVSGFFDALSLFTSRPSSVTISARYISGMVVGPAEGVEAELVLLGNTLTAPTPENPVTYLSVSEMRYNTDEYSMAIGSYSGYKIALMVEEGTTATEYEPYFEGLKSAKVKKVVSYGADGRELSHYDVPDAVQACDGYGLGISTTSNSGFDFKSKTFTKRNEITTVSSSLSWGRTASGSPLYWADHGLSDNASYAEIYCNTYKGTPRGAYDGDAGDKTISLSKTKWYIRDTTMANQNELKEFLRDNPTYAVYTLAKPTVPPISDEIPDTVYLLVEAGGYIVGENAEGIESNIGITVQEKL